MIMSLTKSVLIKSVDENTSSFEGYLSTYGNTDRDGDIFEKGSFSDSLKTKTTFPLLMEHNFDRTVGYLEAQEDEKGIFVKGHLFEDDPESKRTLKLLEVGAYTDMSVGFGINEPFRENVARTDSGYLFKSTYIREGSLVSDPANRQATVMSVKSFLKENGISEEDLDLEVLDKDLPKVELEVEIDEDKVNEIIQEAKDKLEALVKVSQKEPEPKEPKEPTQPSEEEIAERKKEYKKLMEEK